jgi:hypothetical protein
MKIDLGLGGKIIGTKRVSPNGQISGLSEYAGQEVLVILPSGKSGEIGVTAEDFFAELHNATLEHMRLAFKQYKELRQTYVSPEDAAKEFLKSITPAAVHGMIESVDRWVKETTSGIEEKVEHAITPAQEPGGGRLIVGVKRGK